MWWQSPFQDVLNVLFNRILAPYVENLDMNQVQYGIGQGKITLQRLRLKKGALDKFRLPVDVLEGHLGKFTLSLHWMNLGNQPVEIFIEDVYLLVIPSPHSNVDEEEEKRRAQASKAERLENAELLHMRGQAEQADSSPETQGLLASLIAKIINNVQVTIKNVHIRYEDKMSVPGHPFAAGITLAGFTAVSVNKDWRPAFIESTAGSIHKLAKLQALAVYFDTDSPSIAGLPLAEFIAKFNSMISDVNDNSGHQFILKPVSGEGRVIMNHRSDKTTPRFDVQLLFDEIGITLDDDQYRDAISLADMYHVYIRRHQYRKFRPTDQEFEDNPAKARLLYAGRAILDGVKQRNRQWTWAYFAERRDDRIKYIDLFQRKLSNLLNDSDLKIYQDLEVRLSYEDLRFYRSIARSRAKKDSALRKKLEEEKKKQQPKTQTWGQWIWGSSSGQSPSPSPIDPAFGGPMTDEQRQQLYDVLDFDEKSALVDSFEAPHDSLKARIAAKLNKGSLALKSDPHGKATEIISVVFDRFQADVIQRPDNFEAELSLGGFSVFDSTTPNTLYPQIVQVKRSARSREGTADDNSVVPLTTGDPFFYLKFENNPLDERADSAMTLHMKHMEIIYHKGYVEAIYKFFKPPSSQLESVEALLSAASETFEGLRRDTRAGLEYALQTHKTIDIQMDLNAPIIIIPEDITTQACIHLVVDAGHIAVESNLADKNAIKEVELKRQQQYSEQDYKRLESLMYDKFSLRLESAQFLIGNDLQSCRDALRSSSKDTLHLVERINLGIQVQNSIVPGALNLARFKMSGQLPSLEVNLSDAKYKSIMRLIDVCIPKFGDEDNSAQPAQLKPEPSPPGRFQLRVGLFQTQQGEYHIEEDSEAGEREHDEEGDRFFEANDGTTQRPDLHQHSVELDFRVENLKASLAKKALDGVEKPLGDLSFRGFSLNYAQAKFDMKVDVKLQSITMHLVRAGAQPIEFISSVNNASPTKELLVINYVRAQKASPEFSTLYDGMDQNVVIKVSTIICRAAPEPVVSLYDFIMTTFVPNNEEQVAELNSRDSGEVQAVTQSQVQDSKIKVAVDLDSVQVVLVNDDHDLATLSLSTADVGILLHSNTMDIRGRLGSLSLSNDSDVHKVLPEFDQVVSIEGQNFAEFRYQTFDPNSIGYKGIKSTVYLNAASVKLHFLEGPLHDVYLFLAKLAKLKGLYDAATQVAVQRASEIETQLMEYDITIKTPILVFPSDPAQSQDTLVMRLGSISARNAPEEHVNNITASLSGIQLVSNMYYDDGLSTLKIIDDIDINAEVKQTMGIDRSQELKYPDTLVMIRVSDVRLHLTQTQYCLLMLLSQSIPRVLAGAPEGSAQVESSLSTSSDLSEPSAPPPGSEESNVALQPELKIIGSQDGPKHWTTLDLAVHLDTVNLHLYDEQAAKQTDLKDHGIVLFALNYSTVRYKSISDGSSEAQIVIKSFTMSNIRSKTSKFRDIIPAAQHDRNQFMLLYTMTGSNSSVAVLTVDSPHFIFSIDPVQALLEFFMSAFKTQPSTAATTPTSTRSVAASEAPKESQEQPSQSNFGFRIDLHDVLISVLEDDTVSSSQSITLSINQLLLSQQGILALSVNKLGMSLTRMDMPSESVRFLDDFDLTFTMDSRASSTERTTSLEINAKPIIIRASYRDINLITTIVNKAIVLYNESQQPSTSQAQSAKATSKNTQRIRSSHVTDQQPIGQVKVLVSKEQMKASVDGFRLVLIGDLHEQPLIHLRVKPFIANAKDWSSELSASTTMSLQISYWNLTSSHWEPFIDPWTLSFTANRMDSSGGMSLILSSREKLDINFSTAFAEMVTLTAKALDKEKATVLSTNRGSYAPYRIRNRTGATLYVWADAEGNDATKGNSTVKITHDQTVDWRFDDWKTMREHLSASSSQHNIGVQFVGKPWEHLRSVPIDREGEFIYALRPRIDKQPTRVLFEVTVEDNAKLVTIRSTYKIENLTLYNLELTLVDEHGHPVHSLEKLPPGGDYVLPMESVTQHRVRLQPDPGFGYKWCSAIRWEDLIANKGFSIKCPHTDPKESSFRFQAWVHTDNSSAASRKNPGIDLKLRAPIELENLLPYDIQYRIYDKDAEQNWRSYLRRGGVMPVHSVELAHLVLLNVQAQDTAFKPSEFAIINTDAHSDFEVETKLTMSDARNRKLDLKLNYVRYADSGGAFKVQIYSPFVLVNNTGLPVRIKASRAVRGGPQEIAGDSSPDALSKTDPLSMLEYSDYRQYADELTKIVISHPQDNGDEFIFGFGESAWSKPLSFKAPTAEAELVVASQIIKAEEIHVGVSWTEGSGKYKLSKVITLMPRFIIVNHLSVPIRYREHGVPPSERALIEPGTRSSVSFMRVGPDKLLTLAYPGLNTKWSAPINIQALGEIHFRLREGDVNDKTNLVRAEVALKGSAIFVSLYDSEGQWPFEIENESDYTISFSQSSSDLDEQQRLPKSMARYELKPHQAMNYAWDLPGALNKRLMLTINDSRRLVDVMEIGDLVPFKFSVGNQSKAVSLDVRANGSTQILRITNYNPEISMYKLRRRASSVGSISRQDTLAGSSDAFEAVIQDQGPSFSFTIDLAGIGVALINRNLVEVLYVSMDFLKLEYTSTSVAQAVNLSIGTLQVDNQLHDAIFPVVLQPMPIPKEAKGVAALPTVQASVIWLNDTEHGVFFVKYCSILLQALTIEVDEDLLFAIIELSQIKGASWEEETQDILIDSAEQLEEPTISDDKQIIYFEVLELQPIRLSLSFMRTERVSSEEKLNLHNPFVVVLNAITMAIGNVNDAPLEMNALAIKDMRLHSMAGLQDLLILHYRQEVLRQLYRILGSADFIGNPVGLFTNISSGVADIFYEPFNGAVMYGNQELGIGLAKGAASFVKKTVFGFSDAVTKFTGSVSKGLSAATFDSEYQARRRLNQRRNRPRHAIYGVAAGGEALASSFASAVEGVVMKPIEGAESEGALGFFKGIGKGLAGVVTKPVVGVFDLASNVSEGIRNTTTVFDNPERDRMRLPRLVSADGILRPYSEREALGQYWMKDLENGAYRKEFYVAHISTPGSDNIVLLTSSRAISFWSKRLRLEWDLPFSQVSGVTVEDTGIRFAHKSGKEQDKFVLIPDKSSQSWFFGQIATVVKRLNAKKRMES